MVRHLRDAEAALTAGRTIGQICQDIGVSEQTYYRWKNLYGGMKTQELRRLKDPQSLQGEGHGQVSLAHSGRAEEDHVLPPFDEGAAREFP
ncbi:MAG: transposase [Thermoleophilia bacterium]